MGGRIISIGSANGARVPFPGCSLYAMSKAALTGLTKGWARDLGPRGITVTCVQPGPIETDLNPATGGDLADLLTPETALGRFGTVDEVAALVAFLASPESANITGCTLNVDGGFDAQSDCAYSHLAIFQGGGIEDEQKEGTAALCVSVRPPRPWRRLRPASFCNGAQPSPGDVASQLFFRSAMCARYWMIRSMS